MFILKSVSMKKTLHIIRIICQFLINRSEQSISNDNPYYSMMIRFHTVKLANINNHEYI